MLRMENRQSLVADVNAGQAVLDACERATMPAAGATRRFLRDSLMAEAGDAERAHHPGRLLLVDPHAVRVPEFGGDPRGTVGAVEVGVDGADRVAQGLVVPRAPQPHGPARSAPHARRAVAACPVMAFRLNRVPAPPPDRLPSRTTPSGGPRTAGVTDGLHPARHGSAAIPVREPTNRVGGINAVSEPHLSALSPAFSGSFSRTDRTGAEPSATVRTRRTGATERAAICSTGAPPSRRHQAGRRARAWSGLGERSTGTGGSAKLLLNDLPCVSDA